MSPVRITKADIKASSDPNLELLQFLETQPKVDVIYSDVEQCRALTTFADQLLIDSLDPLPNGLEDSVIEIPISTTYTATASLVRPRPNQYTIPGALIVLFHPSGWFVPSTAKLIPYARGLATLFNATVFCPQYRLAPEYPFPIGINDAWASVHWALQNLSSLGANPTKGFILGGISTGANFAVALARRAVETQLQPPVTGIWAPLYIGMRDGISVPNAYKADFTSRDENTNAMVMNVDQVGHLYAHYKPDFASPLFNPLVDIDNGAFDLSKMPRTHLQIAGADYFRDDGIVLAYALEDHGVDVKLDLYPGMPHSFWLFAPEVTTSKKCLKDIVAGFAYLLNVEVEDLPEGWATLLSSMGCQPNLTMKDGGKRGSIEVKLRH